jgi:multisubunit Na+/H+ antiporter MnhF subunit
MGVIFAGIFSGFDRSPTKSSPVTVTETVREYRERIIYLEKEPKKAVNDDPLAISIATFMCLMFLAWGYVLYSEAILSYLLIFLLTTISFSVTTILVALLKGHFNSESWWFYTVFPLLQLL